MRCSWSKNSYLRCGSLGGWRWLGGFGLEHGRSIHLKRSSQHMVKSGTQHMEVWKKRWISCSFRAVFFFFKGSNWLGRSLLGRCPRAGSLSGNSPGNQLFWSGSSWHQSKFPIWLTHKMANINGTNILHQRERKLIFPTAFRCDMMLVPRRVYQICQMILSFRNAERSYPSNKKDFTQSTANIKNFYAQPEKKFHSQFLCCSLPSLSWGAFKKIT